MRIAFLCKRRYMGKDVIDDRYARLYEIPYQLARLGHEVSGFCLDYQGNEDRLVSHDAQPGLLRWEGRSLGRMRLPRLVGYPSWLAGRLRAFKPDLIIGGSDIPHVALAVTLARQLGVPCHVDLYDNFEGFGQARIPGFKRLLREATRKAELVTTTSAALAMLVRNEYRARGVVMEMPSTVDLSVFRLRDKYLARAALGLPQDALLIGTAGGLHLDKGVGVLYDAWPAIGARHPEARLVLAGPCGGTPPPAGLAGAHYLGELPHAQIATLFSALDVGVIYLRDTPFGRYCFPQKAYEMFAAHLPVVASAVGAMPALLQEETEALYRPDDPNDLMRAIEWQIEARKVPATQIDDWAMIIGELEPALRQLVGH
jgi:glycosyltransferase involved in cell wall biosynthesis